MNKQTKTNKLTSFLHRILLLTLIVMCIISLTACGDKGEKVVWSDLILGDKLPELPDAKGELYYNSAEQLYITINEFSDKQFAEYVDACKTNGYTIDPETTSLSYTAHNSEGYKLSLSYYGSAGVNINLEAPMELATITWPTGTAGKMLPAPESTIGNFSYEYDDSFFVYIGNTTKDDFWNYVTTCSEEGFNVDYSKEDNYYSADNADGWHICLEYEGFNIMSIDIDPPSEEETEESTTAPSAKETEPTATAEATEKKPSNDSGLDPDFKAAMDSYENFIDEYVAFMKKYYANPSDMGLLADYADYMTKYSDFVTDFEKWDDEDLNDDELAYYFEVQARVSQKLLEMY